MSDWQNRFSLQGRRALITGASKGIGAEICAVFADAGADIVAVARDPDGLAAVAQVVRAKGRRCLTIEADMATTTGPGQAAAAALHACGTIDILVNCAGIARLAPALQPTIAISKFFQRAAVTLEVFAECCASLSRWLKR